MTVNCVISDMWTRLRNSIVRRHLTVSVIKSNFSIDILKFLVSRGLVRYLDISHPYFIEVGLKYVCNRSVIRRIEGISSPSRRVYVSVKKLRKKYPSGCFVLVSTKKGLMLREEALSLNIGGLIVCVIYF